jgi:hypothetical protein
MRFRALAFSLLLLSGCLFDRSGLPPYTADETSPPGDTGGLDVAVRGDVQSDGSPFSFDLPKFDGSGCPATCVVACRSGGPV